MAAASSPKQRVVALLLSLIPGWGHVYWGRELLGLGIFTVAALIGFAWFNGLVVYRGDGRTALTWVAGVLYVLATAGTWAELFWRTRPSRVEDEAKERERLLRAGTSSYLRKEYDAAIRSFRDCLRLAPQDIEALFRLGIVAARSGDARGARRWFRKLTRFDLEDKWRWEVERELHRLRAAEKSKDRSAGRWTGTRSSSETGAEARREDPSTETDSKEEEEAERASA